MLSAHRLAAPSARSLMCRQHTERIAHLKKIYDPYFANLPKDSMRFQENAKAAIAFKSYFDPFRNFKEDHHAFIAECPQILSIPRFKHPYRIHPSLARILTANSVQLEGSTLTRQDCDLLLPNSEPTESDLADLTAPKVTIPVARTEAEYQEAYFHFVALYFAKGLFAPRNSAMQEQLEIYPADLTQVHGVLMHPFQHVEPGRLRRHPIQVTGFPYAVFPYPAELPTLIDNFCSWSRQPVSAHPVLFACDAFLNFCHLHPYADGNGRLGRLLFSVALANAGYTPIAPQAQRHDYLNLVYEAQQRGRRELFYKFVVTELLKAAQDRKARAHLTAERRNARRTR